MEVNEKKKANHEQVLNKDIFKQLSNMSHIFKFNGN